MYDLAPLYHEKSITSNGACRVCGVVPDDRDAHAQLHLSTAEATVQYDYGWSPAVVRIVPADTVPAPKADTCSVIVDTRNEANARHLRDAHMKAREANRALQRKLRTAKRKVTQ